MIPEHLIERLSNVGQSVFAGPPPYPDVSEYYLPGFLAAGPPSPDTPEWDAFTSELLTELNEAATRLGGWASAGAFYVAEDFFGADGWGTGPQAELMDMALTFMVSNGVDGSSIPMFAQKRWTELRHT